MRFRSRGAAAQLRVSALSAAAQIFPEGGEATDPTLDASPLPPLLLEDSRSR
jgi:hypothetical protein